MIEKDIAWAVARGLPDKEKQMALLVPGNIFEKKVP